MQNDGSWVIFMTMPRRRLLRALGLAGLLCALPRGGLAQEGSGGHAGSGGEGGGKGEAGGHGAGKTPAERARRHRQRTGRTLGGGEAGGGHTGGGGHGGGEDGGDIFPPSDGAASGPVGGGNGGEHFIHQGQGSWGVDNKVLRSP